MSVNLPTELLCDLSRPEVATLSPCRQTNSVGCARNFPSWGIAGAVLADLSPQEGHLILLLIICTIFCWSTGCEDVISTLAPGSFFPALYFDHDHFFTSARGEEHRPSKHTMKKSPQKAKSKQAQKCTLHAKSSRISPEMYNSCWNLEDNFYLLRGNKGMEALHHHCFGLNPVNGCAATISYL